MPAGMPAGMPYSHQQPSFNLSQCGTLDSIMPICSQQIDIDQAPPYLRFAVRKMKLDTTEYLSKTCPLCKNFVKNSRILEQVGYERVADFLDKKEDNDSLRQALDTHKKNANCVPHWQKFYNDSAGTEPQIQHDQPPLEEGANTGKKNGKKYARNNGNVTLLSFAMYKLRRSFAVHKINYSEFVNQANQKKWIVEQVSSRFRYALDMEAKPKGTKDNERLQLQNSKRVTTDNGNNCRCGKWEISGHYRGKDIPNKSRKKKEIMDLFCADTHTLLNVLHKIITGVLWSKSFDNAVKRKTYQSLANDLNLAMSKDTFFFKFLQNYAGIPGDSSFVTKLKLEIDKLQSNWLLPIEDHIEHHREAITLQFDEQYLQNLMDKDASNDASNDDSEDDSDEDSDDDSIEVSVMRC